MTFSNASFDRSLNLGARLKFDADFEGGNLDHVVRHKARHVYDLYIRSDTEAPQ